MRHSVRPEEIAGMQRAAMQAQTQAILTSLRQAAQAIRESADVRDAWRRNPSEMFDRLVTLIEKFHHDGVSLDDLQKLYSEPVGNG